MKYTLCQIYKLLTCIRIFIDCDWECLRMPVYCYIFAAFANVLREMLCTAKEVAKKRKTFLCEWIEIRNTVVYLILYSSLQFRSEDHYKSETEDNPLIIEYTGVETDVLLSFGSPCASRSIHTSNNSFPCYTLILYGKNY